MSLWHPEGVAKKFAEKDWTYITRTLTEITGTPRADIIGADHSLDAHGYTSARATNLDNLDVAVSSRMSNTYEGKLPKLDNLDVAVSSRSSHTPADVWSYATRELTQSKFPFWSAIITQTYGEVSVAAQSYVIVTIQPPSGETWLVWIDFSLSDVDSGYGFSLDYYDYDGTTFQRHAWKCRSYTTNHNYGNFFKATSMDLMKVLTNSLYGALKFSHSYTSEKIGYYGYSGFKLSKPLWSPKRVHNPTPKPWKRKLTQALPSDIAVLEPYACEVYFDDVRDYVPVIMLEEDTPLAKDPKTGFPVERMTVLITAENLVNILNQRDDPTLRSDIVLEAPPKYRGRKMRELTKEEFEEVTGHKKYFQRWRDEGIKI